MVEFSPEDIYIIQREGLNILFLRRSSMFYRISDETRTRIVNMLQGDLETELSLDRGSCTGLSVFETFELIDETPLEETLQYVEGKNLDILLLNVANECNLRCTYCYNRHGSYGQPGTLMDEQVAIRAVDLMLAHYSKVASIQFFGGEPLLNLPIIEAVCAYVTEKMGHDSDKMPIFGVNTNGLLIDNRFIELVKKYKITVSVSLDGCAEVHDCYRTDRNGGGTHQQVVDNILQLHSKTGMPNCIETAYTPEHAARGEGAVEVMEHLDKLLPFKPAISLTPLALNAHDYPLDSKDWETFQRLIQQEFAVLKAGQTPRFPIAINSFLKKVFYRQCTKLLCLSGFYKLAVNASGDIFPCNGLAGEASLCIANVYDTQEHFSERLKQLQEYLATLQKTVFFTECRRCWMYSICSYCYIFNLQDGHLHLNELNREICNYNRAIAEELVVQIALCKENEADWDLLSQYVQGLS